MNSRARFLLMGTLWIALWLGGCSGAPRGASDKPDPDDNGGVGGAGCDPNATIAYPSGPYGHEAGSVIRDFCVRGISSPDASALGPMALHDFYDPRGNGGKQLLFLSGTEMWCDPCNRQTAEYGEAFRLLEGKPVSFFQVIFTGPKTGVAPTESELRIWEDTYRLPFWLAMDDQRYTKEDFPQPHPTALIVDRRTMKIVYRMVGFTPAAELAALVESYL